MRNPNRKIFFHGNFFSFGNELPSPDKQGGKNNKK